MCGRKMVAHEMVLVNRLDCTCHRIPLVRIYVALDITAHDPDDIWRILVALGKELAVCLGIVYAHESGFHKATPDRDIAMYIP